MAFLDKLTDAAAAVTDKANEAIEVTKLKTKINGEKKNLEAEYAQLGKIYYDLIQDGYDANEDAKKLIEAVDARKEILRKLEEELANI